ncbi:hypothetical protein BH10PSE6_BH10PSE6_55520 [soil metagenome]
MTLPNMLTSEELKSPELKLKAQELAIQADQLELEKRKAIFLGVPVLVAIAAGLWSWHTSLTVEKYKADQAKEARYLDAALDLAKAAASSSSVEISRANLRFILAIEVGPEDFRNKLTKYLNTPDAVLPTELSSRNGVAVVAHAAAPAVRSSDTGAIPTANQPGTSGETGWFYLGKTDGAKAKWTESSAISTFAFLKDCTDEGSASAVAKDERVELTKLQQKCLRTTATKYLRDGGVPGQRVLSAVKRTMKSGTTLKILKIDDLGSDEGLPVIWAQVEVL